jgi:hypothetical protein
MRVSFSDWIQLRTPARAAKDLRAESRAARYMPIVVQEGAMAAGDFELQFHSAANLLPLLGGCGFFDSKKAGDPCRRAGGGAHGKNSRTAGG